MAQQQSGGIMDALTNTQGNSADASLGGMAQAIDTKVEAYRNNPQVLEKRLAQNPQLLDLLALQKVKSAKESAAQELLLGEQQNPATILAQREQEVLAMDKNEMAKQSSGILGQRQQQQTKNMQRTASGGNPMMAASGGLLPLPRPNMQGMAQGGIIGYDGGGPVGHDHPHSAAPSSGAELPAEAVAEEVPSGFEKVAGSVVDWATENPLDAVAAGMMFVPIVGWTGSLALKAASLGMKAYSAAKKVNYAQKLKKGVEVAKKTPEALQKLVTRPKPNKVKTTEDGLEFSALPKPVGREISTGRIGGLGLGLGAVSTGIGALSGEDAPVPAVAPAVVVAEEEEGEEELTVTPDDTDYSDGTQEIADRTAPDRTGIAGNLFEQSMPEGQLQSFKDRANVSISDEQKDARAESDTYTRRVENRDELKKGIATQKAFQDRQLDPKKLQKDRLMANLIGGGQRGLLGAAMAGQQADAQVATFEGNQIKEVNRLTNEKIAKDIDVSKIGEANARQVYASLTADKSAAANALKDVTKQNLLEKNREGQIAFETWKEGNDRDQKVLDAEFSQRKADILENTNKATILGDLLTLQEKMNTSYQESIAMLPAYTAGPALQQKAIDAMAQGKDVDFSEDEKNMFIRYQGFLSRMQDGNKTYGELEKEIKKLAGYNDI